MNNVRMRAQRAVWMPLMLCALLAGCSPAQTAPTASASASPTPSDTPDWAGGCGDALRGPLLTMAEHDQLGRTGGDDPESDQQRTDRLQDMIAQCGWPGFDDVGEDGEDAAWLIAQHSDLDPDFQATAVELLRAEVERENATPANLAYLEDRVLSGREKPQVYGTQVSCGPDGLEPAIGLIDPEEVDARRAEVGLESLDEYYASFGEDPCGE